MSLNPSGMCECGCGQPAPIATKTDTLRGYVKGQPRRFIAGHQRGRLGTGIPPEARYVSKDCGYSTLCWVWTGPLNDKGYAWMSVGVPQRHIGAYRWFYEKYVGPIPGRLEPDHLCKNRACVNPYHIKLVTHKENVRRGLHVKLSRDKATEIRRRVALGERRQALADEFGVTRGLINHVIQGRIWLE